MEITVHEGSATVSCEDPKLWRKRSLLLICMIAAFDEGSAEWEYARKATVSGEPLKMELDANRLMSLAHALRDFSDEQMGFEVEAEEMGIEVEGAAAALGPRE